MLFCSIAFLSGCVEWRTYDREGTRLTDPIVVYPSFGSNYLLSCLSDTQDLERKEFDAELKLAGEGFAQGRDLDKLRFICLSLNEKADYRQFKNGSKVLEQYIADSPDSGQDLRGFRVLVDRLDEEIMNRWSAWKSLLNDKKELKAEVESLQVRIEEQQGQIDQLKNIEKIIKSRETN